MKFQAVFFVLFALASSFLSLFAVVSADGAVVSADDSPGTNMSTLASSNANDTAAQPPPASTTNNVTAGNATGSDTDVNSNNNTSWTINAPPPVTTSNDTLNQTESRNTTEAPPQEFVAPNNTTAAPTTTTQSPGGVSVACLEGWRNHNIDDFCQGKTNESVAKCEEKERDILFKHGCWVLHKINATGQNVSKECLQRVTECLSNSADSSSEDIKTNFCRQDKSPSDCFTKGDNSSSGCSADEYQVFRKASDCSSSRRVAEACTLIVLLASVVALALTSE